MTFLWNCLYKSKSLPMLKNILIRLNYFFKGMLISVICVSALLTMSYSRLQDLVYCLFIVHCCFKAIIINNNLEVSDNGQWDGIVSINQSRYMQPRGRLKELICNCKVYTCAKDWQEHQCLKQWEKVWILKFSKWIVFQNLKKINKVLVISTQINKSSCVPVTIIHEPST